MAGLLKLWLIRTNQRDVLIAAVSLEMARDLFLGRESWPDIPPAPPPSAWREVPPQGHQVTVNPAWRSWHTRHFVDTPHPVLLWEHGEGLMGIDPAPASVCACPTCLRTYPGHRMYDPTGPRHDSRSGEAARAVVEALRGAGPQDEMTIGAVLDRIGGGYTLAEITRVMTALRMAGTVQRRNGGPNQVSYYWLA